jgi:hypothetical protein
MKHAWDLCGDLRDAKIKFWSCEVGFKGSEQIEIEWLNEEKTNKNKNFLLGKVKNVVSFKLPVILRFLIIVY